MNQGLLLTFLEHNWILSFAVLFSAIMVAKSFSVANHFMLSPVEAVQKINAGARVLDVREAAAFKKGHIANAVNIPKGQWATKPPDEGEAVLMYCELGTVCSQLVKAHKAARGNWFFIQGGLPRGAMKAIRSPRTNNPKAGEVLKYCVTLWQPSPS